MRDPRRTFRLSGALPRPPRVPARVRRRLGHLTPLNLAAGRRLRRIRPQNATPAALVAFVFDFRFGGLSFAPAQIRSEITRFLELVGAPRRVVEIGTGNGGTLFLLAALASDDATVVTLDLPPREGVLSRGRELLCRSFPRPQQRLEVIRGDSHSEAAVQAVRRALHDEAIDVLFIDGDHSYEGVRTDFERYRPLVRPGGVIGLHDIVPGPAELAGEVPRFWREIRDRYRSAELVESWDQGGYGIGVVWADGSPLDD
jgi:predicted O-methyltransferase YrrM